MTTEELLQRLQRIESLLESLQMHRKEKEFYSTGEVAERLGLSKWYVRRMCATGKILAEKHLQNGRFYISADELHRLETRQDALDN